MVLSYLLNLYWLDDVIKWKHFPRFWPFVRVIRRSPVYSPHKGQWRGALMFSLIYAWSNGWWKNRDASDLRHHFAHYDVTVMDITWMEFGGIRLSGQYFWTCSRYQSLKWVWNNAFRLGYWANKVWWLYIVPTSTTRFASDVGYRMAKI